MWEDERAIGRVGRRGVGHVGRRTCCWTCGKTNVLLDMWEDQRAVGRVGRRTCCWTFVVCRRSEKPSESTFPDFPLWMLKSPRMISPVSCVVKSSMKLVNSVINLLKETRPVDGDL